MTIKLNNVKITQVTDPFKANVAETLFITTGQTLSQRRMDRMWTALKRLPYQSYSCVKAPDDTRYLMGKTDDIIANLEGRDYNIGPYFVCISDNSIITRQSNPIHLFPEYDPGTQNRHLHHAANFDPGINHPLLARPSWCWASIGPSYVSALQDTDIVDMFRLLYIFIIRLNWASPLRSQWKYEAMDHGVLV